MENYLLFSSSWGQKKSRTSGSLFLTGVCLLFISTRGPQFEGQIGPRNPTTPPLPVPLAPVPHPSPPARTPTSRMSPFFSFHSSLTSWSLSWQVIRNKDRDVPASNRFSPIFGSLFLLFWDTAVFFEEELDNSSTHWSLKLRLLRCRNMPLQV